MAMDRTPLETITTRLTARCPFPEWRTRLSLAMPRAGRGCATRCLASDYLQGETVACRRLPSTRPRNLGPARFMPRMRGRDLKSVGADGRTT